MRSCNRCFLPLLVGIALLVLGAGSPVFAGGAFDRFESRATGHSWINTYLLMQAADLAHRDRMLNLEGSFAERFEAAFRGTLGLELVAFLESQDGARADTQALVLRNDAVVLVAFSGSETYDGVAAAHDWIMTDSRVRPIEVDGLRVHGGFHVALESVWERLRAALEGPLEEGLALWLTGHSLGGALANLAAWRLEHEGVKVAGVYTYAAPKVGSTEFVADFEQRFGHRSQQWSTKLDPVTRLPEVKSSSAYEKLGVTNMIHASGEVELNTGTKMSGVPNPWAHRTGAYLNYLYRALPEEIRLLVREPPPLCGATTRMVGTHPEDGWAICLPFTLAKIDRERCVQRGGKAFEDWCLTEERGKFRYRARKLKDPAP